MPMSSDVLRPYVRAGWTWIGPTPIGDPGHPDYYELRIEELPDFFLAGTTLDELYSELRPALRAFFESYTERGEPLPPLPRRWVVSVRERFRRPAATYRVISSVKAMSGVEGIQLPKVTDGDKTSV
jgi:predicted RNase H-like HicB family nuclease